MWLLKVKSYFNFYENTVPHLLKFITIRWKTFLIISSQALGILYTNIFLNKIFYANQFDDAFLRLEKTSHIKRIVKI